MKFWWVNHKQTFKEEVGEGFLWSPQVEKNGARSQFYDNMKTAMPGDIVCSYAFGKISHVGKVLAPSYVASRPDIYGSKGEVWSKVGWLLPVSWDKLEKPILVKENIDQIRAFLPLKYSPIQRESGNGNQKAYLAEIDKRVFDALLGNRVVIKEIGRNLIELADTVATTEIKSRIGQAKFKSNVLRVEKKCRFTGICEPWLLIASHIKPWKLCETVSERLDGNNGLLLPPHIDKLFDLGLITIQGSRVLVSHQLPHSTLSKLGLEGIEKRDLGLFSRQQLDYLEFHFLTVFKS